MSINENKAKVDYHRMCQIFLAKLVLEVFGGGGAIWGFSEVITFRNPSTQEVWRRNAQIVGAIFFLRFLLQMIDFARNKLSSYDNIFNLIRLLQVFTAKIVLEVFGAAGAIWGFSEALTLRVPETNEFYRWFAVIVGIIFFIRFLLEMVEFARKMNKRNDYGEEDGTPNWKEFYHIFAARLVLQVFGGAGAIWGFSEVLTLRNPSTQEIWRFRALLIGFLFFIRWGLQMKDYIIEIRFGKGVALLPLTREQWIRLFQVYSAKIVLEVFGGGGAIWGFSEVLTLRNPETQEFWRYIASIVGFIFFVRYNCQIMDSLSDIVREQLASGNFDVETALKGKEEEKKVDTTMMTLSDDEATPLMIQGTTYT